MDKKLIAPSEIIYEVNILSLLHAYIHFIDIFTVKIFLILNFFKIIFKTIIP